jgi:hypothetical protein
LRLFAAFLRSCLLFAAFLRSCLLFAAFLPTTRPFSRCLIALEGFLVGGPPYLL